jgi:hypothetical protein
VPIRKKHEYLISEERLFLGHAMPIIHLIKIDMPESELYAILNRLAYFS